MSKFLIVYKCLFINCNPTYGLPCIEVSFKFSKNFFLLGTIMWILCTRFYVSNFFLNEFNLCVLFTEDDIRPTYSASGGLSYYEITV